MKIWIVSPQGYLHSRCFFDVAILLKSALEDSGTPCEIVTEPSAPESCEGAIILGAHLLTECPANSIIWNLEQIFADVPWLTENYVEMLRKNTVWDYSLRNIEELCRFGIEARHVPIGYHPCMRNITMVEPSIDILHYGSLNERRKEILQVLHDKGARVYHAFGVYGEERNALIARSKLVINISYYESRIFNIARCALLFANSVPVVSEMGPGSAAFHETGGFVEYGGMVDRCIELLNDDGKRKEVGDKGFDIFSRMKQLGGPE